MSRNLPPVPGPPENRAADHAQCSTDAANSVLQLWYPTLSLPIIDNATLPQIGQAIIDTSLPDLHACDWQYGGTWDDAVSIIDGTSIAYPLLLVQCDSDAQPVPRGSTTIAHYLAAYSTDGGVYQCWEAWDTNYAPNVLRDAYLGRVRIFMKSPPPFAANLELTNVDSYELPDGSFHPVICDGSGKLIEHWQAGDGRWQETTIATGCRTFSGVLVRMLKGVPNVWAMSANGDARHFYQDLTPGNSFGWHETPDA